ncbi:hypothetical protein O9X98_15590 [Agrobacterium salinitolerans]|nr:hypothetical protein [Agrobacterium salinitolerans]
MAEKKTGTYLTREESFMYDKEPKFPLEATSNAGTIRYPTKALSGVEGRRGQITRISKAGAIMDFLLDAQIPENVTLDIPDGKIEKIGCLKVGERRNRMGDSKLSITLRFLRTLTDKELEGIKRHSLLSGQNRRPNVVL